MSRPDYDDGTNVLVRFDHQRADTGVGGAKLLRMNADNFDEVWFPNSEIKHFDAEAGEMWIPEWLARKKGVEYE